MILVKFFLNPTITQELRINTRRPQHLLLILIQFEEGHALRVYRERLLVYIVFRYKVCLHEDFSPHKTLEPLFVELGLHCGE